MAPTYRVIISPEAFADLDSIFAYIKFRSPRNAAKVVDHLSATAQSLEFLPHRHRICHYDRKSDRQIRAIPVRPFVIYYRVDDRTKTVRILTVRHGARQSPRFEE